MHEIIIRYIKVGSAVIAVLATVGVFLYKIGISNLSFDTASLDTTDILSILLATFAVALAVMFYFKGSEESSKFYNNSYQFTKEISELLGRIESGFGEKLRHIDEGYSTIGKRIDDVLVLRAKAEEKLKEEEEDVEATSLDRDQIITTLLEKANVSEDEKQNIRTELEEKDKELGYAKRQVSRYRSQLRDLENATESQIKISPELDHHLTIAADLIGSEHLLKAPTSWLNKRIKEHLQKLPSDFVETLSRMGLTDSDGALTDEGRLVFKQWAKRHR